MNRPMSDSGVRGSSSSTCAGPLPKNATRSSGKRSSPWKSSPSPVSKYERAESMERTAQPRWSMTGTLALLLDCALNQSTIGESVLTGRDARRHSMPWTWKSFSSAVPSVADAVRPALSGRVVVVTGGNQGIGRAIAQAMANAGASLAICARSLESLQHAADEIHAVGIDCLPLQCDVSDPASTDAMAKSVLDHFGRVDVVVANAGIAGAIRPMHEITYDEWRECLATDLDGVYLTFRRFIPPMIRSN